MDTTEFPHTVNQVKTMAEILGWTEVVEALAECSLVEDELPDDATTKALMQVRHAVPAAGHAAWGPYMFGREAIEAMSSAAFRYRQYQGWSPRGHGDGVAQLIEASERLREACRLAGYTALEFARYGHFNTRS
jgi:hypothetical protein